MRSHRFFCNLLGCLATGAMLAGCAGGSPSVTPAGPVDNEQQAARPMSPSSLEAPRIFAGLGNPGVAHPVTGAGFVSPEVDAPGGAAVYVSDYDADTVTVFSLAGKQTAQVTGFHSPEGLTGDAQANVYVANAGGTAVDKYSAGLKKLTAKLSDPGYHPADVSVDPTGIVGVTNISSTTKGKSGSVVFYAKGATTPCATVTSPNWQNVYFGAFDANGNLYIDGLSSNSSTLVGVVSGGCAATSIVTLSGTNLVFPGGVQVGPSGDILFDDQGTAKVFRYKPPVNGAFGTPVSTTSLGSGAPAGISLNKSGKDIYDADAKLEAAQEFAYPAGGSALETFKATGAQLPFGVYVSPDGQP